MAFLNPAVVEAARAVVRQAAETALTTAISVTAPPGPGIATPSAASSPPVTAVTLSSAAPSPTDSSTLANGDPNAGGGNSGGGNGGGGGGGGGNSSSLLFFVALGFGVVFTNLW